MSEYLWSCFLACSEAGQANTISAGQVHLSLPLGSDEAVLLFPTDTEEDPREDGGVAVSARLDAGVGCMREEDVARLSNSLQSSGEGQEADTMGKEVRTDIYGAGRARLHQWEGGEPGQ